MNTPPVPAPQPPGPACRYLRSKQMYLTSAAATTAEGAPPARPVEAFFTCNRTLSALGCDDDAVHPRICGPDRSCHRS